MQNENSELDSTIDFEAESEAAFLAEMMNDNNTSPETVAKTTATEETIVDESSPAVPESDEAIEEEPEAIERVEVIPGFTAEEVKEHLAQIPLLRKSIDTTNGTYGSKLQEQQKLIDELRNRLSPRKLDKVREEYPDLAELLEQDGFGLGGVPPSEESAVLKFDEAKFREEIKAEMKQELEQVKQQSEIKALTKQHPDWNTVAKCTFIGDDPVWVNPEFAQWIKTKGKASELELANSDDASTISSFLTMYKESKKPKQTKTLTKALNPKGTAVNSSTTPLSLQEIEDAAYREEMKRI